MDRSKENNKFKRTHRIKKAVAKLHFLFNNIIMIYIVGPTSSGKTALAVHIASIFNCEIISADSRQVYKFMDIGTGKDLKEYGNIKYHCIDIVDPKTEFNLAKYIKKANKAEQEIIKNNKIPLVVGGTGLYINTLSQGYKIQSEKIDTELRKKLTSLSKQELQNIIDKNYPIHQLNNSDWNNPHRLIRYIERSKCHPQVSHIYDTNNNLILGILVDKETLKKRIHKRIVDRIEKEGMIEEINSLHYKYNVSWKRLESFGLEYKFISQYIRKNTITLEQTINLLATATNQYAKRQITWFKKTPGIIWVDGNNKENLYKETEKLIKEYLNK